MKSLLKYLKDYKKETVLAPFFKMLEALFELFVPLVMAAIIDTGIAGNDKPYIFQMSGILIALGLIGLVCSITAQYFSAKAACGCAAKLKNALFELLAHQSFEEIKVNDICNLAMVHRTTFYSHFSDKYELLEYCIKEIQKYIKEKNLDAEILVSDNNSTDNSVKIAEKTGVRVVICKEKGYGAVLINGTKNSHGKYCIMGDSDGSYDFYHLDKFLEKLDEGYDLVVGNRFIGGIEKGAMSLSHKIGVQILSKFSNLIFHTPIKDYHCGLRAYKKESIEKIKLSQKGMEYASEMIIIAKINNLKMIEVPTILRKDLRNGKPHLRTIRDGFRHLNLICKLALEKRKYIVKKEEEKS